MSEITADVHINHEDIDTAIEKAKELRDLLEQVKQLLGEISVLKT